jgi:parallel beta-helix repeat protein
MKMNFGVKSLVLLGAIMIVSSLLIVASPISAFATTYYVSTSGSDSNSGTSSSAPWATLTKMNSITYAAGDRILFQCGGTWIGQLYPQGSGSSGSPIIINSYGSGNKPIIQANGTKNNALYFKNQSYWEINNLEVTNNSSSWGDFRGISVNGDDYGTINHFYIKSCYVHDVHGEVRWIGGSGTNENGIYYAAGWDASKKTGGIVFDIQHTGTAKKTIFNDVLIQGCSFKGNSFSSIIFKQIDAGTGYGVRSSSNSTTWAPHTNITIKDNYIDHTGYDHACNGIYLTDIKGATVQNNVIKGAGTSGIEMYYADNVTIQQNEVFNTTVKAGGADSNGIDPDSSTTNIIVQYNYVHNNGDGILFCQIGFGGSCTVRYNILQNNSRYSFNLHSASGGNATIYNNDLYVSSTSAILVGSSGGQSTLDTGTYSLKNNIFYSFVSGPTVTTGAKCTFDYNCYYGATAVSADGHKVTSNPLLVSPGTGGSGSSSGTAFSTLTGYMLQSTSPCINNGTSLWSGGADFWGTTLYNSSADIGVDEY